MTQKIRACKYDILLHHRLTVCVKNIPTGTSMCIWLPPLIMKAQTSTRGGVGRKLQSLQSKLGRLTMDLIRVAVN